MAVPPLSESWRRAAARPSRIRSSAARAGPRPSQSSSDPLISTATPGNGPGGRHPISLRRIAKSPRAAATAMPWAAMVSSKAVSQSGSAAPSARWRRNKRARWRWAFSKAPTRLAWAGSKPNTRRSIKRRRAAGASPNRRSMRGVSHTALRTPASAAWPWAGRPSMRTSLRSGPAGSLGASRPVPMSTAPLGVATVAATAHARFASPSSPGSERATSPRRACLRPRPGTKKDSASKTLVLPAPLGPVSTTGRRSVSILWWR